MRNKSKSLRTESKGVLYSSDEHSAFLKYGVPMGASANQRCSAGRERAQRDPHAESFPSLRPSQDTYHYLLQNGRIWNQSDSQACTSSAAKMSFWILHTQ